MRKNAFVTGAGGFIGGHLVRRLLNDGYDVTGMDIKPLDEWWQVHPDALSIAQRDVGHRPNLVNIGDMDEIYHLAENMGGIGFIETHLVDCANSITTTINLLNAVQSGQKVFFSSSACVYNVAVQGYAGSAALREEDAWPALPEEGYGFAKLYAEELCKYHAIERGVETRVARFHNSYGPHGSWKDGREKAPAAICRKVAEAVISGRHEIDIWGDGQQRRSFMYIDDNVDGIRRIMDHEHAGRRPINLGTSHSVSIDDLVTTAEFFAFGHTGALTRHYQFGRPQGVRNRNSDNEMILEMLNWEPSTPLLEGLEKTYEWIYNQVKSDLNVR